MFIPGLVHQLSPGHVLGRERSFPSLPDTFLGDPVRAARPGFVGTGWEERHPKPDHTAIPSSEPDHHATASGALGATVPLRPRWPIPSAKARCERFSSSFSLLPKKCPGESLRPRLPRPADAPTRPQPRRNTPSNRLRWSQWDEPQALPDRRATTSFPHKKAPFRKDDAVDPGDILRPRAVEIQTH
jgi:hypothetical protein